MNTPVISIRNVIVQLVRGPLYQEDSDLWSRLLRDQDKVKLHFHMMGLDLVLDEDAGYAFLRNESGGDENEDEEETESEAEASLPRLMRRNALSFLPTVLLLELRERLLRHDQSADGTDHLYLDFEEIREFMQLYCDETGNEKKIEAKVRAAVARLCELSVLRSVTNRSDVIYRVEPILRAKLPVDQIEVIRDRLKAQLGRDDVADKNQEQEEMTEE